MCNSSRSNLDVHRRHSHVRIALSTSAIPHSAGQRGMRPGCTSASSCLGRRGVAGGARRAASAATNREDVAAVVGRAGRARSVVHSPLHVALRIGSGELAAAAFALVFVDVVPEVKGKSVISLNKLSATLLTGQGPAISLPCISSTPRRSSACCAPVTHAAT